MGILNDLFSFFFPPDCIGCGEEGRILCEKCVLKIPRKPPHVFSSPHLSSVTVLGEYEYSLLEKALHEMKYRFATDVVKDLSPFFSDVLSHVSIPPNALLVPIPLHFFRLHERGFNQSELLAYAFADFLFPKDGKDHVKNLLKRTRNTPHQARLSSDNRIKNVENAFSLPSHSIPKETPLVLIDDVASTLSTLHEAAKVLRAHGFSHVSALVLARSQQDRDKK